MKNTITSIALFCGLCALSQTIAIPDANFKYQLVNSSGESPYQFAKDNEGNWLEVDANNDGEIQVSEAQQVDWLFVTSAFGFPLDPVSSLEGIQYFIGLRTIDINQSDLTQIDFSGCTSLEKIDINGAMELQNINMSGLSSMQELILHSCEALQTVNITGNTGLKKIDMSYAPGLPHDLTGLTSLETLEYAHAETEFTLDVSNLPNLKVLDCSYGGLTSIEMSGASALETVNLRSASITSLDLSGLPSLREIITSKVPAAAIDFTAAPSLETISCGSDWLTALNVQNMPNLKSLSVGFCNLTELDLTGLTSLETLNVNGNSSMIGVPLHQVPNLRSLNCTQTPIAQLDLSAVPLLENLNCYLSNLSSLDFSGCVNIKTLSCSGNQLTSLDLSMLKQLESVGASSNPLVYLNLKNGAAETVSVNGALSLGYICADENQIPAIRSHLDQVGLASCNVNSYCSFAPGAEYYIVNGQSRIDGTANGCDASDQGFENLIVTFDNDGQNYTTVSNPAGVISAPLIAGTYTVTPHIENPEYFTISPQTATVSFPDQAAPFAQDFCIVPNGDHRDLEIGILPLVPARPGFDATYRILYKNKGSVAQSGTVTFQFPDDTTDALVAVPTASTQQQGLYTWQYENLLPMESRQISLVLNVNSPMETPAVNIGDQLNLLASVTPVDTDALPADNAFSLKQLVVGSYDPNDKTCLEGATVGIEKAGEYIHYLIRFENTGTFAAQNIVVRDMVDTDKFDVSTLIPLTGSHPFETRITEGNKVEFIFENIMLPFDDANNDGYVAFKIKIKPTLVSGDTFSNTASIYFDYNFPIVTNSAVTTLTALSRPDFAFSDCFTIYPNPAGDVLNIAVKHGIEMQSIDIYNMIGQLVLAVPNAAGRSTVDVSGLAAGSYVVKIASSEGASAGQMIKK